MSSKRSFSPPKRAKPSKKLTSTHEHVIRDVRLTIGQKAAIAYCGVLRADGVLIDLETALHYLIAPQEDGDYGGEDQVEVAGEIHDAIEAKHALDHFLGSVVNLLGGFRALEQAETHWATIGDTAAIHGAYELPRKGRDAAVVPGRGLSDEEFAHCPAVNVKAMRHSYSALLSVDAWSHIGSYLSTNQLLNLPCVSRFHFEHREEVMWAELYRRCFGVPSSAIEESQYRENYFGLLKKMHASHNKLPPEYSEFCKDLAPDGVLELGNEKLLITNRAPLSAQQRVKRDAATGASAPQWRLESIEGPDPDFISEGGRMTIIMLVQLEFKGLLRPAFQWQHMGAYRRALL